MKNIFIILIIVSIFSLQAHESSNHEAETKKALKAIGKLGMNLKKKLRGAMQDSPVNAVKVCNIEAGPIAEEITKSGIEVGRVSRKNRNPKNTPKDWMLATIEAYHAKKITDPYTVVQLKNGKHGIIRPITTMPVCLKCHGEKIDPKLKEKIHELYPNDIATGYKSPQIRGFFWAKY